MTSMFDGYQKEGFKGNECPFSLVALSPDHLAISSVLLGLQSAPSVNTTNLTLSRHLLPIMSALRMYIA